MEQKIPENNYKYNMIYLFVYKLLNIRLYIYKNVTHSRNGQNSCQKYITKIKIMQMQVLFLFIANFTEIIHAKFENIFKILEDRLKEFNPTKLYFPHFFKNKILTIS